MRQLRDVLIYALTVALFLVGIVALDALTGVPFSYGVPLSAILSLLPYAFMLRRGVAAREAANAVPRRDANGRLRPPRARRSARSPAAIHSVVFLP
jgi:hypothetical protein